MIRLLSPELEAMMVDAALIHPHPDNANNGDVDAIVESMVLDGVYRPIYASRATGNIVGGHHVYEAMLREGFDKVPVSWVDTDREGELRILAKDNRIARLAWVDPALELELVKKIAATDQGLAGSGYDDAFLIEAVRRSNEPYRPEGGGGGPSTQTVTCPHCGGDVEVEVDRGF